MFGIGTTELLVILVVALIVVGPKQLPKIARTLGKAMGEFKRVSTDLHRTINTEMEREDHEKEKKKKLADKKKSSDKAADADKDADKDATKEAAAAEKSQEDIKAEKAYQSAMAANTVQEQQDDAAAHDIQQDQAAATDAPTGGASGEPQAKETAEAGDDSAKAAAGDKA